MEIQFPLWLSKFLSQPREDGAGSLFLQYEELQEQLRNLERKILAKVSEDQRLSARDIGVALQREGATGLTEEVRICLISLSYSVVPDLASSGWSQTAIPINTSQHDLWSGLLGIVVCEPLEGTRLGTPGLSVFLERL